MCGLCGRFELDGLRPANTSLVWAMSEALAHRGPDDATVWTDGPIALGHRRLSIIDLEGGRQPASNETGEIQVVLNGEIYNFRELTRELKVRGHTFRTHSDTEVLAHAYEEWAYDFLSHLRGMFALALWDGRERRLLLARDRLGIKPLLYYLRPGQFIAFASELKALWCDPEVPLDLDVVAVDQYLSLQYVPAPRSGLLGIQKLPPATAMVVEQRGVRQWEYWDPTDWIPIRIRTEAQQKIRAALTDAVRSHLVSDVPVGTFLSGGVDSGVVTALTAAASPDPVRAITVGFSDSALDERSMAGDVAKRYGCLHHQALIDLDVQSTFERTLSHLDEPFADWSALPTFLLAEAARREVKVVLSGDGGDELFGGYARHRIQALENRARAVFRIAPQLAVGKLARSYPRRLPGYQSVQNLGLPFAVAVARKHAHGFFADYADRARLYGPAMQDELAHGPEAVERYVEPFLAQYERVKDRPPLAAALYLELKTYLVDDILTKVDRMSMAHSLEVRVPFLDHRMVEVALAVPAQWKVNWRRGKRIYRDAFRDLLPEYIWDQKKRGFDIPAASWLRGELRDRAADLLLDETARHRQILDAREVKRLWEEHQRGLGGRTRQLWALLMLESWLRNLERQVEARRSVPIDGTAYRPAPS